jgi:uncharacterized membrane protein
MPNSKLNQLLQTLPYLLGIALITVGSIGFLPNGPEILGTDIHHINNHHNYIHLLSGIGIVLFWIFKSPFTKLYLTLVSMLYLFLTISGIALNGNVFDIFLVESLDNTLHFGIVILCIWFAYFPPFTIKKPFN